MFSPEPDFDENVYLARFANLLFHYTGNARDRRIAEAALRFAATPNIANARLSSVGALILADQELASDPLHIAIVGKKSDAMAPKLFAAAVSYPVIYKQVEWIDLSQKSSTPDAAIYPDLPQSAAYICTNHACSTPVFDEAHLLGLLDRRTSPK
jgi:uncharacterized protein YyaL (SSP411 family)